MTDQKEYTPEVVFGPIKEPVPTTDWRWQEVLALEPFEVMEELKELDTALFAARSEQKEAVRELADLEDVLYKAKQEALEGIQEPNLRAKLFKGGTKDERKERQEMHLAEKPWVRRAEAGIKVVRERKDNAQVALDSMLDRQVNLGKFANMYSATARLLATIRAPDPAVVEVAIPKSILAARESLQEVEATAGLRSLYAHIIHIFASQPTKDVHPAISSVYEKAQAWVQWSKEWALKHEAAGPPPVDTSVLAMEIMQVAKPIQAPPDLEPILEDEVLNVLRGIEIPVEEEEAEIEIPAGMDVTEEEAEAIKAAIRRSEEDLPFQPDEDLSL